MLEVAVIGGAGHAPGNGKGSRGGEGYGATGNEPVAVRDMETLPVTSRTSPKLKKPSSEMVGSLPGRKKEGSLMWLSVNVQFCKPRGSNFPVVKLSG